MKLKKIACMICTIAMVGTLFAGCGSSGSSSSEESSASSTASSESGKHINAALYWFGTSLDPATEWDGWTTCRAGITETLVTVDENYEIQPLLADKWEQTDGSTWVMHIREGVTFQDGSAVDGAAVKAALERAMEVQERAQTAAKIDSIEADGQNVTIKTTEPFGAFLANISEPLYSIIKVDDNQDYANAPIGTGPFMVTDFEVNDYIETIRYDGYWGGASDVESMTVKCIEDDSTRGLALQSGEEDVVQKVANTDLASFQEDDNYQVFDTTGARERLLLFNYQNELLADASVRKAISEGIDYDSLVSVLGGAVTKAGAPYPSSAPYGYDELDKQEYNADDAKALLEKDGFTDSDNDGILEKDGAKLSFEITYENTDYTTMLEAVQSMEKEIGIDIQLNLTESITDAEDSGNFDIICTNWQVLSTGDPQWFLDSLYKTDAASNCMSYSNADLDKICDQMTTAFDTDSRKELTIEAEKILLEDTASIWLVGENNFVVANSKIKNVTPYPIDYYFVDNNLSIGD